MLRSEPRQLVALIASLLYILVCLFGGFIFSWMWFHWIFASFVTFLSFLFWPTFLYDTFKAPKHVPVFTWQIDHQGGGIGVVIAFGSAFHLMANGSIHWASLALFLLTPILGITFSLLSESAIYVVQRWRWARSQPQ